MNRFGPANWHQQYRAEPEYAERAQLLKWSRGDFWAQFVKKNGVGRLWSSFTDEVFRAQIQEEIAKDLGYEPAERVSNAAISSVPNGGATPGRSMPFCPECFSVDIKRFDNSRPRCKGGWGCESCRAPVLEVFGCLSCARVVCGECYQSLPEEGSTLTLWEIGEMLGVSNDRVRQIEQKALAKLFKWGKQRRQNE